MREQFNRFFLVWPLLWLALVQQPVDNLTVLNRLGSAIATSLLDQLEVDTTTTVVIRSAGARDSCTWWFENHLIQALNDRGLSDIKIAPQSDAVGGIIVEYQVLSLGVKYLPIDKTDAVQRQASIDVAIRVLLSPRNAVHLQRNFTRQFADTVAYRWLGELENKMLSFTMAEPPAQRDKFKKYFEPLSVIATTGTVVVLFYYLRSK